MSQFFLYRKQRGEGCDYTIGCAESLTELTAKTREAARIEAMRFLDEREYWQDSDSEPVEMALLLEKVEDLTSEVQRCAAKEKEAEEAAALEKKRAELAKLKRELGET